MAVELDFKSYIILIKNKNDKNIFPLTFVKGLFIVLVGLYFT